MQRILIYDPQRVPRHWVELLKPGQFAIILFDIDSPGILDETGLPASQTAASCLVFDDFLEARQFCDEFVQRVDHVRCEIYDHRGMAVQPLATIVSHHHRKRIPNRTSAAALMATGVIAPLCSAPLFWYDWRSDGARIWPTLIGINLVVVGVRLILWGYGMLEQCRQQETRAASAAAASGTGRVA